MKFQGKDYQYIDMSPNQTRVNERRMELPLAFDFLGDPEGKEIIEVGNVTGHYRQEYSHHDVLDLYEKVPWNPIINDDVLTWKPTKKYTHAISISTIEHTLNPTLAVDNIITYAPRVLITFPFGYNGIDALVEKHKNGMFFLRRVNDDNEWEEVTYDMVKGTEYNTPFPFANAIGVIRI